MISQPESVRPDCLSGSNCYESYGGEKPSVPPHIGGMDELCVIRKTQKSYIWPLLRSSFQLLGEGKETKHSFLPPFLRLLNIQAQNEG